MRVGDYQIDNEYDAAGQLIRQLGAAPDRTGAPNNSIVTDYAYALRGNNIAVSSSLGHLNLSTFNRAGELVGFS
jgi:hypothetical protein